MALRVSLILVVLMLGCPQSSEVVSPASEPQHGDVLERDGNPAIVTVDPEDPEIVDARLAALASIQTFIQRLPELEQAGAYVSVKIPIGVDPEIEQIWLESPVRFNDGAFHGTIGNEPLLPEFSLGDPISVPVSEISDWMVVVDGRLYGGFTVLVTRSHLSPEQQAQFDAMVPFEVPDMAQLLP